MYLLWCNFILGLNCIFLHLKLIITHYRTQRQRKIPENKIEPQHIHAEAEEHIFLAGQNFTLICQVLDTRLKISQGWEGRVHCAHDGW